LKILVSSHAFAPSVGGIETVSALLAEEFCRMGHEVIVVTQTSGDDGDIFAVVRQPSGPKLFSLVKWCDVFWHNNLSLRSVWPAFFLRKPLVITHQGSYSRRPSGVDLALRLKHALAGRAKSVAISRFVASFFKPEPIVIPNPYDARAFTLAPSAPDRTGDLIFVGRLVSEKGLNVLFESLGHLRSRGLKPGLLVVGSGPEEKWLRQLVERLGIHDQITFAGAKQGAELSDVLHRHKILIVPSRYDEPFGVVALEGIACGCAVIGSSGGGLPEAIGPCGITFPNGNAGALADAIEQLLAAPDERQRLIANRAQHLARFHPVTIAESYLNLFRSILP
jgi:glycosyltransferase involved in cell wall biosynthesis